MYALFVYVLHVTAEADADAGPTAIVLFINPSLTPRKMCSCNNMFFQQYL